MGLLGIQPSLLHQGSMLERMCAPRPNPVRVVAQAGFNNGNGNKRGKKGNSDMNKRASTRVTLCRSGNKAAREEPGTTYNLGFDKSEWPSDRLVNLFCGLVKRQKSTFEAADLVPVLELANKWERDRIAALHDANALEDANQALRSQIAPLESSYHELRAKSSSTLAGLTFRYLKVKGADDVRALHLKFLKEQIALGRGLDPGEHTWVSIWEQVLRHDLEENDLEKKCDWKSGGQAAKLLAIESSLASCSEGREAGWAPVNEHRENQIEEVSSAPCGVFGD